MYEFNVSRMLAVAERDLRRFRRNAKLFIPMTLMPIVYLVILGKSMGGDLHNLPVAIVVQDEGRAAVNVRDRMLTLAQSRTLFHLASEPDPATAVHRLQEGDYKAVVIVPPGFSEHYARGEPARVGLIVD